MHATPAAAPPRGSAVTRSTPWQALVGLTPHNCPPLPSACRSCSWTTRRSTTTWTPSSSTCSARRTRRGECREQAALGRAGEGKWVAVAPGGPGTVLGAGPLPRVSHHGTAALLPVLLPVAQVPHCGVLQQGEEQRGGEQPGLHPHAACLPAQGEGWLFVLSLSCAPAVALVALPCRCHLPCCALLMNPGLRPAPINIS